jgi:hypothetical protein
MYFSRRIHHRGALTIYLCNIWKRISKVWLGFLWMTDPEKTGRVGQDPALLDCWGHAVLPI